ncbi:TPA: hypothetical protein ACGO9J_001750 [Streptococcus suis]
MIVYIYLMGMVCFSYASKVWEKRIILSKKNRIDIQTKHQCSTYAAAYILRNYGITAVGVRTLFNYTGENEKRICVSKGLRDLLRSYGFEVIHCSGNMNALKYEIRNGNPVIIMDFRNLLSAKNRDELRQWLLENHNKESGCWQSSFPDMFEKGFVIDKVVLDALQGDAEIWETFKNFRRSISV